MTAPLACLDCGLPYADFPLDVNLPRAQWLAIHPDDGGVLCACCIVARVKARIPGATVVHAVAEVAAPEFCVCAALLLLDGRIIRGHRHNDCFATFSAWKNAGQKLEEALFPSQQGFMTSRGRFVGREEGLQLQLAAGIESAAPDGYRGTILFSEDLY